MLCTEKLCSILTTLGGNPAALSDMMDVTIIDAIVAQLNAIVAQLNDDIEERTPTAAEVATAIGAMTADQVSAVKTKLGIS